MASDDRLPGERAADWLAYALVVSGAASLVWRRRYPIAVLAIVTALLITFWLRDYSAYLSVLGLPALFAVAVHAENRRKGVVGARCRAIRNGVRRRPAAAPAITNC